MSERCYAGGCTSAEVRRCYFCPNVCCSEHGTIGASGVICGDCSASEREKHEQAARQQEQQAAAAKTGSSCLVAAISTAAFASVAVLLAVRRHRA